MTVVVIIIAGALLLGIIFLRGSMPGEKIDREDFISKVEDYVEAEREPISEFEGAYKIDFTFEGGKYSFEDTFVMGFNGPVQKVQLKHFMDNKFSLNFSEKKVSSSIRTDILLASEIPDEIADTGPKLEIAKDFNEFIVQTNNIPLANKLLNDKKAISVFNSFKNKDNRGRPFFSLKIVNGIITLHFHGSAILNPSLPALQGEIATLENYIDKIMVIANKLKS